MHTGDAGRLLESEPLRALVDKRLRHSFLNPRNRFVNHLLSMRARHTRVLRSAMRHRERVDARLDHPFDPTPIRFAFSTRPLEQHLKIAERRKIGLTRLLNRLQKRTHKPAFRRINMHAPVPRRLLDPRDLLRETEVPTLQAIAASLTAALFHKTRSERKRPSFGRFLVLNIPLGVHRPYSVAAAVSGKPGNHVVGTSANSAPGTSFVHQFRTRTRSRNATAVPSAPFLPS